jgi:Mn2+/Fe2+ NRAMP family transporter
LLSGLPYRALILLGVIGVVVISWVLPFEWLERLFGYVGLSLLVFAVAAIKVHPHWGGVAHGFVPGLPAHNHAVYLYFVVGLLGAALTPYEVYFYSSGAVEDGWGAKDLRINKITSLIGYGLGAFLSFSLMIVAAVLFLPRGIDPQFLGTPALGIVYFLLILAIAVSAIPLMLITNGGQG